VAVVARQGRECRLEEGAEGKRSKPNDKSQPPPARRAKKNNTASVEELSAMNEQQLRVHLAGINSELATPFNSQLSEALRKPGKTYSGSKDGLVERPDQALSEGPASEGGSAEEEQQQQQQQQRESRLRPKEPPTHHAEESEDENGDGSNGDGDGDGGAWEDGPNGGSGSGGESDASGSLAGSQGQE
jgi:hypothetical protein